MKRIIVTLYTLGNFCYIYVCCGEGHCKTWCVGISSLLPPWGSWGSNSGPQACAKCQYPLNHLTGLPRKLEQKDTFYYFQHDTVFFLFCSNYSSKLHCFSRQTPQQLGKGRKMVSLHLIITALVYLVCRSQVFCQTP